MTAAPARVLGVDPGSLKTGWAVVGGSSSQPSLLACGEIGLSASLAFETRLARLHADLAAVVAEHRPTHAAVEAPFHGISARSALQLAHARGVVLAVLGEAGVPVTEYAPATIKKAVTGRGNAEKIQVSAMVRMIVRGGDGPMREDVSDAVAAALCHVFRLGPAAKLARAIATTPS